MGSCYITQGAQLVLCDDLEGQDLEWVRGRLKREEMYVYIYITIYITIYIYIYMKPVFTQCFTAEINTTLQSNYPPIKKKHTQMLYF